MKRFKIGVSNWELVFDDEEIIKISQLKSEKVEYTCDGDINIELNNACFVQEVIDKITKKSKVLKVKQSFILTDGDILYNDEYEYDDLNLNIIQIDSDCDTSSEFKIFLTNNQ